MCNIDNGENNHAEGLNNNIDSHFINTHIEGVSNNLSVSTEFVYDNIFSDGNHVEGISNNIRHGKNSELKANHIEGSENTINCEYSWSDTLYNHIEGYKNTLGSCTPISYCHIEGCKNTIGADMNNVIAAHAEGYQTWAPGYYSHSAGYNTIAEWAACTTVGMYNKTFGNPSSNGHQYSDLFVVGNGQSDTSRSNAFRVHHTDGVFGGTYNSTGADYAEYFEWADGNPNNEDRIGCFVSLVDGDKIQLASFGDEILGVISGNGSVVGDSYDDTW